MKDIRTPQIDRLFDALTTLNGREEYYAFFADVCTIKELLDMAQRFEVAGLLRGGRSYADICKLSGASTATISRVNKCLGYGDGYGVALERLDQMRMKRSGNIECVFIDIDDTLLDFDKCGFRALSGACEKFGIPFDSYMFDEFGKINSEFWKRVEKCEITREELGRMRFVAFFEKLGINADGVLFNKAFYETLGETHDLVDGADKMLAYLSGQGYKLFITSNGFPFTQKNRIRLAGFSDYFADMFVSEEVGAPKPDKRFFDVAINAAGVPRDRIMIIGDSLSADMAGGIAAGIRTCWFDKNKSHDSRGLKVDHAITSLDEITAIL